MANQIYVGIPYPATPSRPYPIYVLHKGLVFVKIQLCGSVFTQPLRAIILQHACSDVNNVSNAELLWMIVAELRINLNRPVIISQIYRAMCSNESQTILKGGR